MTEFLREQGAHDHRIRRGGETCSIRNSQKQASFPYLAVLAITTQDSDPKQQNAELI